MNERSTEHEWGTARASYVQLLRGWALSGAEVAALLDTALPPREQELRRRRLRYIVGGLYLLFPENPDLRATWVRRANTQLAGRTPLEVMLTEPGGVGEVAGLIRLQLSQ